MLHRVYMMPDVMVGGYGIYYIAVYVRNSTSKLKTSVNNIFYMIDIMGWFIFGIFWKYVLLDITFEVFVDNCGFDGFFLHLENILA